MAEIRPRDYVDCSPGPDPSPDPALDPTADDRPRGFTGLICPLCGEEAVLGISDLSDLSTVRCESCGDEIDVTEAVTKFAAQAKRWRSLLGWLRKAPVIE